MDLSRAADDYERSTRLFLDEVALVDPADLDRHVEGGWSARQIIHHVADSETHSYLRLRRLLAEEPGTLIQGYDGDAWAENEVLGYRELDVEAPLAIFTSVRASSARTLRRLSEPDLSRYGEHSESGRYTLARWLELYTNHPREHATQMREARTA